MVEAPGTAPGSETLIPRGVYRHSRFPDTTNISTWAGLLKAQSLGSGYEFRTAASYKLVQ